MPGPAPDRGTEVYCYRIPRDCFEDELVPVFQTVGKLYELRLMIEFSGANRSYCYVRYCNTEDAKNAIKALNNFQIRPGYPLAVTKSVDNRKLCIKTVPQLGRNVTEKGVTEELAKVVDGVLAVKFIAKRWLKIEFETHRFAALARRQLVPGIKWIENNKTVVIGDRRGNFDGMIQGSRIFNIVLVTQNHGVGVNVTDAATVDKVVTYDGTKQSIAF